MQRVNGSDQRREFLDGRTKESTELHIAIYEFRKVQALRWQDFRWQDLRLQDLRIVGF
jgi:hypothetical protein